MLALLVKVPSIFLVFSKFFNGHISFFRKTILTLFKRGVCVCATRFPTSFLHVTSRNVRFSSKKLPTVSLNSLATQVKNSKAIPSANRKLLNLNQVHPLKEWFFWSNPYKIDVIITSFIEMLELPNFKKAKSS